ncbi:MAG: general secretion pathway protein GspB [Candidatus Omnitrophica bacterium]|nr:general secretion pathway protein GspB [Candidatus Omnitrophota bacterium]
MKQGNVVIVIILCLILPAGYKNNESQIISYEPDSSQNISVSPKNIDQSSEKKKSEMPLESGEALPLNENPFLSAMERINFGAETKEIIDYLTVTAIFHSEANSHAVIDGRVLREKDEIDGKEIVKIEPEEVILRDANGEYVLRLKTY